LAKKLKRLRFGVNGKIKIRTLQKAEHAAPKLTSPVALLAIRQPNDTPVGIPEAYKPNVECPALQRQLQCLKQQESLMSTEINFVKGKQKEYKFCEK
jgi:hypothetical protein